MKLALIAAASVSFFYAPLAPAESLQATWSLGGFSNPESSYWEKSTNEIVVSQMGKFGPQGGTDGKLSLVSIDGKMLDADWFTGLIDPKGMVSSNGILYVVDATGIVVIDVAAKQIKLTIPVSVALLLNDIAISADGTLFVTDLAGNSVVRIKDGQVSYLVPPGKISLPNGIVMQNDRLIVGSFGEGKLSESFTVDMPGGLLVVDPVTGTSTQITATKHQASVDGIAAFRDWVIFADNPTGRILGLKNGELKVLAVAQPGIADLDASPDLILVPNSRLGTVSAYQMQ